MQLICEPFFICRYDPDEIEEEQRERERRNQINKQFSQFVKRVQQDIWERDYGQVCW
jgi:nucleosome binding factor SPN SPT16 subunit